MEKQPDSNNIFEEREEVMVSPTGGNPTLRKAHFLKPIVTSIDGKVSELPPLSHSPNKPPACHDLTELSEKVSFRGWKRPTNGWKIWVGEMHAKHQALWKQVGIYEAIMSSKYEMIRHKELVLGLVEKWCPKTNTFVFGWGEATITLEDLMVLGGYPVLGQSVLRHDLMAKQLEVEEKLNEARKAATSLGGYVATHKAWVEHFRGTGNDLEHEAFLSLWLSKFVLLTSKSSSFVVKRVFPIAIHLARGNRVALAPAVLSSIYRDLTLLKDWAFGSNVVQSGELLNLYAPFQLVLLWVWERFPGLRPMPNSFSLGEPRVQRWHKLKMKVGDMKLAIDSAEESFQWRPYAIAVNDWNLPKIYGDKEQYILVDSHMDNEQQSFARCLRVSELVGVGCIEQYLPHRVAMQFGMDQDIPASIARCNKNPEMAWRSYSSPIQDTLFYLPPRLFESDVTERYSNWWKQSILPHCDAITPSAKRPRSPRKSPGVSSSKKQCCTLSFNDDRLNCEGVGRGNSAKGNDMEDQMTIQEWFAYKNAQIVMDGVNVSTSTVDKEVVSVFQPMVTVQYSKGWKKLSLAVQLHVIKGIVRRKRSSRKRSKRIPWVKAREGENEASSPPGFAPKQNNGNLEPFRNDQVPKLEAFVSPSTADDGGSVKMSMQPEQKVIHPKAENGETESKIDQYTNGNISKYGESDTITLHMKVSRLESRIARLEKLVAELLELKKSNQGS